MGRHDDHSRRWLWKRQPNVGQYTHAIEDRHRQVEQDQIRDAMFECFQCRRAIGRLFDHVAVCFQTNANDTLDAGVVIDHENVLGSRHVTRMSTNMVP